MGAGALRDDEQARDDASGERRAFSTGARVRTLHGFIAATREVLGESVLERVRSELSPRVIEALQRDPEDWVPLEHVIAWCEESLRDADAATIRAFVAVMMNHGFGRVRRVLLQIATPHGVLRRATELWRDDFSDGRLVAYATSPNTAVATLYEHRFLESELLRAVVAESFRYVLELSGAADAIEEHTTDPRRSVDCPLHLELRSTQRRAGRYVVRAPCFAAMRRLILAASSLPCCVWIRSCCRPHRRRRRRPNPRPSRPSSG